MKKSWIEPKILNIDIKGGISPFVFEDSFYLT